MEDFMTCLLVTIFILTSFILRNYTCIFISYFYLHIHSTQFDTARFCGELYLGSLLS